MSACVRRGPSARLGSILFTASCRISSSCCPGDGRDKLSHSPWQEWGGIVVICLGPLTCWVLVHQPCKALGSCGGCEGTAAGAAQCQQLPEQPFLLRDCHLEETQYVSWSRAASAPSVCPWSLVWTEARGCLGRAPLHPAPHQRTLQGKEQTKAMRRATRRLCASKHSPSCKGRTVSMSSQSFLPACANILVPSPFCCPSPNHQTYPERLEGAGKTVLG